MYTEQDQKRQLIKRNGWQRDGGGDVEHQPPLVEESLVAAKSDADLLWEGGAQGVVHRGGEGHEERHVPEGHNDAPTVKEGVLITGGLTKDIAKAGLYGPFPYLVEGEAVGEGRQVLHVQFRF